MDTPETGQIGAIIRALGLESYLPPGSAFEKAVIGAARKSAGALPVRGDVDTLIRSALQPGMLTAMAAEIQRGTDTVEHKYAIADAMGGSRGSDRTV